MKTKLKRVAEQREELLDARDVVEAVDDFLTAVRDRGKLAKLEAANKEYWRKWGEE